MRTKRAPVVVSGYLIFFAILTFFLLYENVQGQLALLLPARSEQVFLVLTFLQMTVVAFLTPAFAAGAISGERERRTLAVSHHTAVANADSDWQGSVIQRTVGAASVCHTAVVQPVFLFGGAVPQEVLAVFGFQLLTIVLIATLSVLWSTIALRSGWSTVLAYATVGWMVIFTGVVGYGLKLVAAKSPIEPIAVHWSNILLSMNPLWIQSSFENVVSAPAHSWLTFMIVYVVVAVVLVVPALVRLRPQVFRAIPGLRKAEERDFQ